LINDRHLSPRERALENGWNDRHLERFYEGCRFIKQFRALLNCFKLAVMRWFFIFFLIISLLPVPVLAQAAPRGCFTKAEETAEQIVREGLRLREGAKGCAEAPWRQQTLSLWNSLDQRLGPQFAAQTLIRQKAFQREFSDDADNRLQMWNGRIVFYFRNYPLSEVYCAGIKDMLEQMLKKGWGALKSKAGKGADEVKMDYRPCE
jgi:hypothetical protein